MKCPALRLVYLLSLLAAALQAELPNPPELTARGHLRVWEEGMLTWLLDPPEHLTCCRFRELDGDQRRAWTELILHRNYPNDRAARARHALAVETSLALCQLEQRGLTQAERAACTREIFAKLALQIFPKSLKHRLGYHVDRAYSSSELSTYLRQLDDRTILRAQQIHHSLAREFCKSCPARLQAPSIFQRVRRGFSQLLSWAGDVKAQLAFVVEPSRTLSGPPLDASIAALLPQTQVFCWASYEWMGRKVPWLLLDCSPERHRRLMQQSVLAPCG